MIVMPKLPDSLNWTVVLKTISPRPETCGSGRCCVAGVRYPLEQGPFYAVQVV